MPSQVFIRIGFVNALRQFWWAFFVPLAIGGAGIIWLDYWYWFVISAVLVTGLYLLFWYIQFYGITQLPQGKTLFEKYSYEFKNEHIVVKKSEKEGMMLNWPQIVRAEAREEAILLWVGRFQFFYLPNTVFTSDNDRRWVETVLRRKKLLEEKTENGPASKAK